MSTRIIPASLDDWKNVRNICCLTGDDGKPISKDREKNFAEHWIGPYQKLVPDWTWVAKSNSEICGYLAGCPDTPSFFQEKTFDLRNTVELFSVATQGLIKNYNAHLHINLLPEYRGREIGKELLRAFFEKLRRHSIDGAHVFCGKGPLGFYTKNGFEIADSIQIKDNDVFALIKKL